MAKKKKEFSVETQTVKIGEVKTNPNNPRFIKDDKFEKLVESIKSFPQMLQMRPICVNDEMIVLGGNMRLRACQEAGLKEVTIVKASNLTEAQQNEFIIKDNASFGSWDWEVLGNEWNENDLQDWGIDIPGLDEGEEEPEEEGEAELKKMSFVLSDEQHEHIKNAISEIKKTDEFKFCETFGNESPEATALYLMASAYLEQRK